MSIASNIADFQQLLEKTGSKLVAVTKTMPVEVIMEAYHAGFRRFGENRVQELVDKQQALPKDIEWHMIGHLQRNKVKFIVPFVSMIHGVDSIRLLSEINKEATKKQKLIPCLLQVHIAKEESKFGFDPDTLAALVSNGQFDQYQQVKIAGLMGMATFTSDMNQVRLEFRKLKSLFDTIKKMNIPSNFDWQEISMGMSNDYKLALEEGSTLIRIGSSIFGARN